MDLNDIKAVRELAKLGVSDEEIEKYLSSDKSQTVEEFASNHYSVEDYEKIMNGESDDSTGKVDLFAD